MDQFAEDGSACVVTRVASTTRVTWLLARWCQRTASPSPWRRAGLWDVSDVVHGAGDPGQCVVVQADTPPGRALWREAQILACSRAVIILC